LLMRMPLSKIAATWMPGVLSLTAPAIVCTGWS
jgi:hypothetical protein